MSVKMHFLRSHLDYFPYNCGDYSEEQREREITPRPSPDGRKVPRNWDVNMLAQYC